MAKSKKKKREKQVAALPVSVQQSGRVKVLIVTSRDTGRWIIPKGWPIDGKPDHQAAAVEAFEEAGLIGLVDETPIGSFDYTKIMPKGEDDIDVRADVYVLKVKEELKKWPEASERDREWVTPKEAAKRVEEPDLKALITRFTKAYKIAS